MNLRHGDFDHEWIKHLDTGPVAKSSTKDQWARTAPAAEWQQLIKRKFDTINRLAEFDLKQTCAALCQAKEEVFGSLRESDSSTDVQSDT